MILNLPPNGSIENIESHNVLKALTKARAALAELKGVAKSIPNEQILIETLTLQEAKDSSAIENIVTTYDELYRNEPDIKRFTSAQAKEVYNYAKALRYGFKSVSKSGLITVNSILKVQELIEGNLAGIRRVPGTVLRNDLSGAVVYTPPQDYDTILDLMHNLEEFINDTIKYDTDPLIKMALIHHQFESIHPFFDGNGRTGRIINILYLIKSGLLDLPILYLSRYIIQNRSEYYELLQSTRETNSWEPWILYILNAVESTSTETVLLIHQVKELLLYTKARIKSEYPRMYSQDLINSLFKHPYTKIEVFQKDLGVSRVTATKYLNKLSDKPILDRVKVGKSYYFINRQLVRLLTGERYG